MWIFATYGVKEKLLPRLARLPVLAWAGDSLLVAVMMALVIVFLRPINQFIIPGKPPALPGDRKSLTITGVHPGNSAL